MTCYSGDLSDLSDLGWAPIHTPGGRIPVPAVKRLVPGLETLGGAFGDVLGRRSVWESFGRPGRSFWEGFGSPGMFIWVGFEALGGPLPNLVIDYLTW